jgi:hypothetical protein
MCFARQPVPERRWQRFCRGCTGGWRIPIGPYAWRRPTSWSWCCRSAHWSSRLSLRRAAARMDVTPSGNPTRQPSSMKPHPWKGNRKYQEIPIGAGLMFVAQRVRREYSGHFGRTPLDTIEACHAEGWCAVLPEAEPAAEHLPGGCPAANCMRCVSSQVEAGSVLSRLFQMPGPSSWAFAAASFSTFLSPCGAGPALSEKVPSATSATAPRAPQRRRPPPTAAPTAALR